MEKFKEKRIVTIFDNISATMMVCFILGLIVSIFFKPFLLCIGILPFAIPFIFLSWVLFGKDKYTSVFMEYMRTRIDKAKTLDELRNIITEFESLAISKGGMYDLSYPVSLRKIHNELRNKIEVLEQFKNQIS